MFLFGPVFFNVLTAPALAPFPVVVPHPSSSVISRACWFGEFLSLCLREEGQILYLNSVAVLNQTQGKAAFHGKVIC